jgi:hypothetical protein
MNVNPEKDSGKKDLRGYIFIFIALIIATVTDIIVMKAPGDPINGFTIIVGIICLIFAWIAIPWVLIKDLNDNK